VHELAIAQSVVRIAEAHAEGRPVVGVNLKVGHLRQVMPSALRFSFQLASQGTALDGAELRIEEVPAAARCRSCSLQTVLEAFPFECAECGGSDLELVAGEELLVESIDV